MCFKFKYTRANANTFLFAKGQKGDEKFFTQKKKKEWLDVGIEMQNEALLVNLLLLFPIWGLQPG